MKHYGNCTPQGPATAASVLVPIVNHASGLTLLLTQRTTHLPTTPDNRFLWTPRAGRWICAGNQLREAEEEIGLHRDR
jgi:hypothetical protein